MFKDEISNDIKELKCNTCSNSVLWAKIDNEAFGFDFILGSVYIPHESSKFYDDDIFESLSTDIIMLKSLYNLPVCLIGDFNSRTGNLDDFMSQFELDMLDEFNSESIPHILEDVSRRYNMDKVINKNGQNLTDICKSLDLMIVNGRIGGDANVGRLTCAAASTVDYCVVSHELFPKVCDFFVDEFDSLMSDKHSPICLTLFTSVVNKSEHIDSSENPKYRENSVKINWNPVLSKDFCNNLNEQEIMKIVCDLDYLSRSDAIVDQVAINSLTNAVICFSL